MRQAPRNSPLSRPPAPVAGGAPRACLALAGAALVLAGCQNSLFRDAESPFTVPDETLRAIEPLDTSRVEYGPPVPPDEAIADATAGGFRPTQYERTRSMSIAEVRALTLANNLDLRVQLVAPEIAKTTVSQEEAKFDSTFFADFRRNGNNLLTQLQNNEGLFDDQLQLGLTVPLATGGAITVADADALQGIVGALLGNRDELAAVCHRADDARHVVGTGSPSQLLSPAVEHRFECDLAPYVEQPHTLRASELVGRQAQQIDPEVVDGQVDGGERLHGVGVHGHPPIHGADDLGHRLDHTGLVVRHHHRHHPGSGRDGAGDVFGTDTTGRVRCHQTHR